MYSCEKEWGGGGYYCRKQGREFLRREDTIWHITLSSLNLYAPRAQ